ncbi:phage replisome organizer N-terminal domain-containing protein [Leuconostoc citreum]
MADNKKYYYIRLKENFFDSDEIKLLESVPNDGYKFSNILLKMYLKSLKYNGRLMFNERIPFNKEMLATVTNHSVGDVTRAIDMFKKFGLIEVLETGEIYMLDIQSYIGRTSTEADRIKAYRKGIEQQKSKGVQMYDERTPEIEIELEKELEIKKEIDKTLLSGSDEPDHVPYKEIVDYLNEKTGKKFKSGTDSTKRVIRARFNEGNSVNDFKSVIDVKSKEWLGDMKMAKYLQPSTLFGTKFEGYLNQSATELPKKDLSKMTREEQLRMVMGEDMRY